MPAGERQPIRCVRPGCGHAYTVHGPHGGGCLYWFPLSGEHCDCHGFQFVALDAATSPGYRSGRRG